jgi:hypothetical protein
VLKLQKISRGGGSLLDNKKVTFTPTPTNSITDTLRSNSNIQFSSNSRSSAQGGEIAPPKVSIGGAQHYENNFMINGISNNNNLNPGGIESTSLYGTVYGESQSLFIDTSLVDNIKVFTEAVSAEYGGFTGGVVDTELRNARTDRWHIMTKYRYTKDSFAKFHPTDEQKAIEVVTNADYQPNFNKHEYTIAIDGPIGEHLGAIFSYTKQRSKIPYWSNYNVYNPDGSFYKERTIDYRTNDNYLVRLNTHNIDDLEASLTAIYAPYTAKMNSGKNGEYDYKGGGTNIALDIKNYLNFGEFKNSLAYKQNEYTVDPQSDSIYYWNFNLGTPANWGDATPPNLPTFAIEGYRGGKREFAEEALIYKSVMEFDRIESGSFDHMIKLGAEAEIGTVSYNREAGYFHSNSQYNSSASGGIDNDVLDGYQWQKGKSVYLPMDNKKSYVTAALFLEDTIAIDRYEIRPGVRISTDSIMDNIDIAPRLFANADVFDDGNLNIYGGYNRYYGSLVLINTVNRHQMQDFERADWNSPWVAVGSVGHGYSYSMDGLKTPYTDEFSIGSSLSKWNTLFKIGFVDRSFKNQLMMRGESVAGGGTNFVNTNNGKTDYWGITLTASKEYELGNTKHFSELSITRSDRKSNMMGISGFSGGDSTGNTESETHITYNGVLTLKEDVPSIAYNSPWIVTLSHMTDISDFLHIGATARYEKGGEGLKFVSRWGGVPDPNGYGTTTYEKKKYSDTFYVDLQLNYDLKFKSNKLTFGLEVLNLFDRVNETITTGFNGSYTNGYAMGRQFYANFRYEY